MTHHIDDTPTPPSPAEIAAQNAAIAASEKARDAKITQAAEEWEENSADEQVSAASTDMMKEHLLSVITSRLNEIQPQHKSSHRFFASTKQSILHIMHHQEISLLNSAKDCLQYPTQEKISTLRDNATKGDKFTNGLIDNVIQCSESELSIHQEQLGGIQPPSNKGR